MALSVSSSNEYRDTLSDHEVFRHLSKLFDRDMQAPDVGTPNLPLDRTGHSLLWRHARHLLQTGPEGMPLVLEHLLEDARTFLAAEHLQIRLSLTLRELFNSEYLQSRGRLNDTNSPPASFSTVDSQQTAKVASESIAREIPLTDMIDCALQVFPGEGTIPAAPPFLTDLVKLLGTALLSAEHEFQQQQVQRREKTLLRELHHRTKNNLQVVSSLLDLQGMRSGSLQMEATLSSAAMRVRTVAIAHDTMCQTEGAERMDLRTFALGLISALRSLFGLDNRGLHIDVQVEELALAFEQATPCALILNELLCNAFKHAFPDGRTGTIQVRAARVKQKVEVVVADDGIGFPVDLERESGFGFTIIRELADQIDAELSFNHDSGLECRFNFEDSAH